MSSVILLLCRNTVLLSFRFRPKLNVEFFFLFFFLMTWNAEFAARHCLGAVCRCRRRRRRYILTFCFYRRRRRCRPRMPPPPLIGFFLARARACSRRTAGRRAQEHETRRLCRARIPIPARLFRQRRWCKPYGECHSRWWTV